MTCARCFSGRHVRCRCGCPICKKQFGKVVVRVPRAKPRPVYGPPAPKRSGKNRPRETRKAKLGFRTTLTDEQLTAVYLLSDIGLSISAIARLTGLTRDKVRSTQQNRKAPASGPLYRVECLDPMGGWWVRRRLTASQARVALLAFEQDPLLTEWRISLDVPAPAYDGPVGPYEDLDDDVDESEEEEESQNLRSAHGGEAISTVGSR